MNTRSGYVIDDTADLQSTRHLTQATSCRTIYEMPFEMVQIEPQFFLHATLFPRHG